MTQVPDIYFLKEWGQAYQVRDNGEATIFEFKHDLGHVYYQFIRKAIPQCIESKIYYDTITPYGFNGPIILEYEQGRKEELIRLYDKAFHQYCQDNDIVAEYVRFSPWLKNHLDFESIYTLKYNEFTMYIDLTVNDFFMDEFDKKRRNRYRKSIELGVEIEFDFTGESIGEFNRIYQLTADKNDIGAYYKFSDDFLKDTFRVLKEKQFIINAIYEGKYVSSAIFFHHGDYMHAHLAANDPLYFPTNGDTQIIYEACKWGVNNKKTHLHLGGAPTPELLRFKKLFTKNGYCDFYVGKKVRNQLIYDKLLHIRLEDGALNNPSFFPEYRG